MDSHTPVPQIQQDKSPVIKDGNGKSFTIHKFTSSKAPLISWIFVDFRRFSMFDDPRVHPTWLSSDSADGHSCWQSQTRLHGTAGTAGCDADVTLEQHDQAAYGGHGGIPGS